MNTLSIPDIEQGPTAEMIRLCLALVRARFADLSGPIRVPADFKAQDFISLSGKHGISAALAGGIKRGGIEGPYAVGLQMMLDTIEASNAVRNSRIRTVLTNVGQVLKQAGIKCVALKGSAFLAETDTKVGWRFLSDIDVLVDEGEVLRAAQALMSKGYIKSIPDDDYRPSDRHHFTPLIPPGGELAVELHTRLVWDRDKDPLDDKTLLARSRPSTIAGILVLPAEHRLIHLIIHGQLGDKAYAARRILLKDILDFGELVHARELDWTEVERAFVNSGQRPIMSGFLKAAEAILDDAMPTTGLDLHDGETWAQQALHNLATGQSDRSSAAADIVRDYASRVLFRKGGLRLLVSTLLDRRRLVRLWDIQSRKWRS